jgi:hypothetical protein
MALPPIVIGELRGTAICVPPSTEPVPVARLPPPVAAAEGAADPPPITELVPAAEMALPVTEIGAVTGASTCVPPAIESVPLVSGPVAEDAGGVVPPVVPPATSLVPSTEMALPAAEMGAITGATT